MYKTLSKVLDYTTGQIHKNNKLLHPSTGYKKSEREKETFRK